MGSEECEGDSSAQVGHRETVLLEGMRARPRCTTYACFPPRLVLFFRPVATQPAVHLFLKNPWAAAVKVFRVERADWKPISATQVTSSSQLILNISYLPQTKPHGSTPRK